MKRYIGLDIIRGIGVFWMVIYHLYFDVCTIFGYQTKLLIDILGNIGGIIFIVISGYAFFLASQKYRQGLYKKYLPYSLKLGAYAIVITVTTFFISPDNTVWFGVLHFFSLAFLLLLLLYKVPNSLLFTVSLTCLFLGYAFNDIGNGKLMFFLGFSNHYSSGDYYPIFPYFGYILGGYMGGVYAIFSRILEKNFLGKLGKIFALFGKKSLLIYLVHQPIIYVSILLIKEFAKN